MKEVNYHNQLVDKISIVVRKVTSEDTDRLIKLYEDVWSDVSYDKKNKAEFVLIHSHGISYCAEMDGEMVGSRTSFYVNVFSGTRKLKCVQIGDSCVKKKCRGAGLFTKMNKAFLDDFFVQGELIYNISEEISRKAYEKLGWNYIESYTVLRYFPNILMLFIKLHGNILKLWTKVEYDKDQSVDLSLLDQELLSKREDFIIISNKNAIHTNYDADTVKWRFLSKSGMAIYKLDGIGAIVFKKGKNDYFSVAEIGEVFLYDYRYDTFNTLMKSFQKSICPDVIMVAITIGHPLYNFYKKKGYIRNFKHPFLNHGVKVTSDEMKKLCYEPKNWSLSTIDMDTF